MKESISSTGSSQAESKVDFGGYTLIEIWVVITIIAILASLLLAAPARAEDQAKAISDGAPRALEVGNLSSHLIAQNHMHPIPETPTIIVGALLLLPLGASALRIVARNRAGAQSDSRRPGGGQG